MNQLRSSDTHLVFKKGHVFFLISDRPIGFCCDELRGTSILFCLFQRTQTIIFLFQLYSTKSTLMKWTLVAMVYRWISNFSHCSNSLFNGGTFWRFSRLMMLHVPRARSMTNWASICGLRCNQKENRNTHHTVGPTGIDVEHHLQGNYDTRTTTLEIYFWKKFKDIPSFWKIDMG